MYKFKTDPWDHQREALLATWDKEYAALLMDYGTGKTKVVIDNGGILFEQKGSIDALFIIAPNEVHTQWIDEQIPEHLPDHIPRICRTWESSKNSQKYKRSLEDMWAPKYEDHLKIFSMNVEALQTAGRARNFAVNFLKDFRCFLVMDESTRIKTPGAKRTRFIVNRLAPLAKYRRTLTGNEITRSPFDIYAPYRFLSKNFWDPIPNHHIFTHRYAEWKTRFTYRKSVKVKNYKCGECLEPLGEIRFGRINESVVPVCPLCGYLQAVDRVPNKVKNLLENQGKQEFPVLISYKNLGELRAKTQSCSYQVRKEDCMDLPAKIHAPVYTSMNREQERVYSELKNNLFTIYEDQELTVTHKIALFTRFQQIIGGYFPESEKQIGDHNPKLERLIYDLEDIDTKDPVIIWARYIVEIRNIAERLKKEYPDKRVETFYGETSKPDRKIIIEAFKKGEVDLFVANPSVAGTGLNLQAAYINYYYSNSFMAEDRWQSEDRTHRGGQINRCLYKDILIKGTVDDTLMESNKAKVDLAEYFKDRDIRELV